MSAVTVILALIFMDLRLVMIHQVAQGVHAAFWDFIFFAF
jgi:hypothetical protein